MISAKQNDKSDAATSPKSIPAITRIAVAGFKSLQERTEVEIRPLTLLAGANSSGKSSLMQPALLLKQTLDATFDPGPLKLDGPNVWFTSTDQIFSKVPKPSRTFSVTLNVNVATAEIVFEQPPKQDLQLQQFIWRDAETTLRFRPGAQIEEVTSDISSLIWGQLAMSMENLRDTFGPKGVPVRFMSDRFLPRLAVVVGDAAVGNLIGGGFEQIQEAIESIIHLPGLRGNPARAHPRIGTGPKFPGTFESYTATLLHAWQRNSRGSLSSVSHDLQTLGLTWKVEVAELDQTQLELRVGRLCKPRQGGAHDLVNIADVGFGVSQVLPVVVALRAAQPGQLIYVEQPELHLHPRAQAAMASLLADAARRGVRVVAETHSQELLLGVQTLVAEGKLESSLVKLHWFGRDSDGWSTVTSADLDETGAFGDWPVDFADVSLETQSRYLDAAEAKGAQRAAS